MQKLSRRALARYAADQIAEGVSASQLVAQLAAVLAVTKRPDQAGQLAEDIAFELESRGLAATAVITIASELSASLKKEIEAFVKQSASVKQVRLVEHLDKSIIGGLRIETAKLAWDETLKRRLTDIKEAF